MASIIGYTKAHMDSLLALLAPLVSPIFTGTPQLPSGTIGVTQSAADNSTKLSTTAFVHTAVANLVASSPGTLDTLNELAAALGDDPNFAATTATALGLKAPLASPVFTGDPQAPTAAPGDNDTSIATTAFVQAAALASDLQLVTSITTAYTLQLSDANKVIEANFATIANITVPLNATVPFPIGTIIRVTWIGTAKPTVVAAGGVGLNSPGGVFGVAALWGTITLRKRATDIWILSDAVG